MPGSPQRNWSSPALVCEPVFPDDQRLWYPIVEDFARLKQLVGAFTMRRFQTRIVQRMQELNRIMGPGLSEVQNLAESIEGLYKTEIMPGKQVLDLFIEANRRLPPPDRTQILAWKERVSSIFEVRLARGRLLELHNLIDDLDYRVVILDEDPNSISRALQGGYFFSRLLPFRDAWSLSGLQTVVGISRREALKMAARWVRDDPAALFRNPEYLKMSVESLARSEELFRNLFGKLWITGTAPQIEAALQRFMRAANEAAAQRSETKKQDPDTFPKSKQRADGRERTFRLPDDIRDNKLLGLMFMPNQGIMVLYNFQELEAAFADPEQATKRQISSIRERLNDPDTPAAVFLALASAYPEQASLLLRKVLNKKDFAWDRDHDSLLRKVKPGSYPTPPYPTEIVLPARLADALDDDDEDSGAQGTSKPPSRPSKPALRRRRR